MSGFLVSHSQFHEKRQWRGRRSLPLDVEFGSLTIFGEIAGSEEVGPYRFYQEVLWNCRVYLKHSKRSASWSC